MSNDQKRDDVEDAVEVMNTQEIPDDVDWFLMQGLLNLVELGNNIGITLSVKGVIISGICISALEYLDEISSGMNATLGPDYAEIVDAIIAGSKENYPSPEDIMAKGHISRGYIHLKDACYFTPGKKPMPSTGGMLWRGKVAAVDGFSLGTFSYSES